MGSRLCGRAGRRLRLSLVEPESESYEIGDDAHRAQQLEHARWILENCSQYALTTPKCLLDIGSNTGALLEVATNRDFETMGIELEADLIEASRQYGEFKLINKPVEQADLPANYFSAE